MPSRTTLYMDLASILRNPTGPSGSAMVCHRGFGDRSVRPSDPAYQDALLAAAGEEPARTRGCPAW